MNDQHLTWWQVALMIYGALMTGAPAFIWLLNKGRKQARASISKTEGEVYKDILENRLVEKNITDIINEKAKIIEEKYKDIIFNMQQEHFEIKKDIQGRLEKEMKARIEAEQENEILKNELHLIKEKSDDQDKKIEMLTKKVKELEKNKP